LAEFNKPVNELPLVSVLGNVFQRFDRFDLGEKVINISGDLKDSLRVQARLGVTNGQSLEEMQ